MLFERAFLVGYMGQGAEHSSCRVERFLQQVEEDEDVVPDMAEDQRMQIQTTNWQVVNCTTPANYYHVLRRQVHREFRKPLIVVAPKNLLRDKRCTSTLEEMGLDTKFKRVFGEKDTEIVANADKVRTVVYCSGKIYYEIIEEREKRGIKDVAVVRLEQLAPFPWDRVSQEAALYKNASNSIWCQEEPKNMGPWSFVQPRFATATRTMNSRELRLQYCGRRPSAAVATGLGARAHNAEQEALVKACFE